MHLERKPNRLIREPSPYLRQHAYNPVDWYPWGEEAFARARQEDKPVFLSVGYSACHWCHVMEHESFENETVAGLLNEQFVAIKVDREQHPGVDALYMTATQLITQRGGWPNSVWLTPDARPWYAGTYFPPEDRHGRMGFLSLLKTLGQFWRERRVEVEKQAELLFDAIREQNAVKQITPSLSPDGLELARCIQEHYRQQFDAVWGGFGSAPKFPPHSGLLLLMRTLDLAPSHDTEIMIQHTLGAMLRGGIYDQIGGGFHRYSTDERWLLPHFEKMLYDNAMLLRVYAEAAARWPHPEYIRVVNETTQWMFREMTHPDGGFFAALDADSEGEEGKFYTWPMDEIQALLTEPQFNEFCRLYQCRTEGNFRDESTGQASRRNIPALPLSAGEEEIEQCSAHRNALLAHRDRRIRPGRDEKVITAWNGLMIGALAAAGRLLPMPALIERALAARAFVASHLQEGDRFHRSWCEGQTTADGVLDDYAAMALADAELFLATGHRSHLQHADNCLRAIRRHFFDESSSALFMTPLGQPLEILRVVDLYDQGSPAGIGLTVQAASLIGSMGDGNDWGIWGQQIAARHFQVIQRMPSAVASLAAGFLNLKLPDAAVNTEISSGVFYLKTPVAFWDSSGKASITLAATLPPLWRLNALESAGAPKRIRVAFAEQGKNVPARLDVKEGAGNTWVVTLELDEQQPPPEELALRITYQICAEQECRPEQTESVDVTFSGK